MTESQLEVSETTRNAVEEDLIEESAFEVKETDQYTQQARNNLQTSTNEKPWQAKLKATRKRRSFLGQQREWKFR